MTKEGAWKFFSVAKEYTHVEWETFMRMHDEVEPGIRTYLEKDVGHEKWAQAHFSEKVLHHHFQ